MLEVGVFPARVGDASVVEDGWRVVAVLLEGELDCLARPAVHAVEHAHGEVAVLAGQELVHARAQEDDLVAVRQVAAVPPLDVKMTILRRNEGRPWNGRRQDWNLVDAEEVVGAPVAGEEDARGVEVEVEVAHDGGVGRAVE